jgi:hypothetical protein
MPVGSDCHTCALQIYSHDADCREGRKDSRADMENVILKTVKLLYQVPKSELQLAARDVLLNSARKYIIYFNQFTVNTLYTLCRNGACCTKPEYVIHVQFVQIRSLLSRKTLA